MLLVPVSGLGATEMKFVSVAPQGSCRHARPCSSGKAIKTPLIPGHLGGLEGAQQEFRQRCLVGSRADSLCACLTALPGLASGRYSSETGRGAAKLHCFVFSLYFTFFD